MRLTASEASSEAGHFLVCGMGQLGHCIVGVLTQMGHPVVCLTQATRSDWLRAAEAKGVQVVLGDARDEEALRECGLLDARALIVATDHDAINIEVALTAKGLRPDLPIVVRVRDRAVAPQLEAALGVRKVLAMSALAAPVFAAGVLADRAVAAFDLGNTLFVVGSIPAGPESAFQGVAPASFARAHGLAVLTESHLDPRSALVGASQSSPTSGGFATFLADAASWRQVTDAERSAEARKADQGRRRPRLPQPGSIPAAAACLASRLRAGSSALARPAFLVAAGLLGVSLLVFQVGLGLSFIDALYFITTTITTTGYGDISLAAHPDPFKLYAVLLMLVGSAAMGALYSWMTGFVVAEPLPHPA